MHPRRTVSPELARLAGLQAGVITTEQAVGLGQTRHSLARLVDTGSWQRLASGLYLTGSTPDFPALAWGGVLLGGDRARLGPQASGHLHELLGAPPTTIDVLVPDGRRVRVAGPWQFIRDRSSGRSARVVGSPPRLDVVDTVLDLAGGSTAGEVVSLVTRAVQTRRTTAARLLAGLDRRVRHPHRALLRAMLEDVADGAESALELLYLRDVERPHGFRSAAGRSHDLGCATAAMSAMTSTSCWSSSTDRTATPAPLASATCGGTTGSRPVVTPHFASATSMSSTTRAPWPASCGASSPTAAVGSRFGTAHAAVTSH